MGSTQHIGQLFADQVLVQTGFIGGLTPPVIPPVAPALTWRMAIDPGDGLLKVSVNTGAYVQLGTAVGNSLQTAYAVGNTIAINGAGNPVAISDGGFLSPLLTLTQTQPTDALDIVQSNAVGGSALDIDVTNALNTAPAVVITHDGLGEGIVITQTLAGNVDPGLSLFHTGGTAGGYIEVGDSATAAVSPANRARVRYVDATPDLEVSMNGGAYVSLTTHTLDDAYDGTGGGAGRTIIGDSGPVVINTGTTGCLQLICSTASQQALDINLTGAVADVIAIDINDATTGASIGNLCTIQSDNGAGSRTGHLFAITSTGDNFSGDMLNIDLNETVAANVGAQACVMTDNAGVLFTAPFCHINNTNAARAAAAAAGGVLRVSTTGAVGATGTGVHANDAVVIDGAGHGIVLETPNGLAQWRVTIDNAGSLVTTVL